MKGQWTNIFNGDLPLRSWWVDSVNECEYVSIVLPEVFGINNWIRSFSEKLAQQNVPVLALPLYGRTAPNLDLAYSDEDLKLGRHHKNLTTSKNIFFFEVEFHMLENSLLAIFLFSFFLQFGY